MALGGGTFIAQNKVLPGAYINFISVAKATATLSDRGFAAMGLELDWGQDGQIFEVTQGDFQKDSMKIFGYSYADDKLKGIREMMSKLKTLYAYKLTSGGEKASNKFATAKYCGVRGNDIKIAIQANVDDNSLFDVQTILDTTIVDVQVVAKAEDLVANDYVSFKGAELALTASTPLTGGTNGTADAAAHQAFLDKVESYPSINAIGYVGTDNAVKSLYAAFTERMRDSVGVKFVAVLYNKAADYEGVINVINNETAELVYWVTGAEAGCAINKSCLNKKYDGEYEVNTEYTQAQLENAIDEGYCYGYNIVLSAIESVFGLTENYWKVVNKLKEWDNKREKEIEDAK